MVAGAVRFGDGRIVVACNGSHDLRLFDPDGVLVHIAGREGDGPGEFRWIAGVERLTADSILVFDSRLHRITSFSDSLVLAWGQNIRPPSRTFADLGRFADGRWYALEDGRVVGGRIGTLNQDSVALVFFGSGVDDPVPAATLPGTYGATFSGIRGETGKLVAPFSSFPLLASHGDRLFVSSGGSFDILIFRSSGELAGFVRNPWQRISVTTEHQDSWVDARLERVPDEVRPAMRVVLSKVPRPDQLPASNSMIVDALGHLWVQRYEAPDGPSKEWVIFRPEGTLLGTLELPTILQVFDVGADYILGKLDDANGEEILALYPLDRGGR